MIFASPLFLFAFLPAVLLVYLMLPGLPVRNLWLLLASVIFYSVGEPRFVAVLLVSVAANYAVALGLERQKSAADRKCLLALGVAGNLGLLVLFKYSDALVNLGRLTHVVPAAFTFEGYALPLGISFFTFHALSYLIDVYRRNQRAAVRPWDLALYIFFFPQLIAGPILRWQAIAPQLLRREHSLEKFSDGIRRLVIGLAKKVIIANTLAVPVDQIFALPPSQLSTAEAWLGMVGYTLQIYFDFSGYSDMAVGMGKMFGFEFLENFRFPYTAQSIRDFWRRWHISLSTWFRDYLYFPLGGNRGSHARTCFNLFMVFFLCGLWHGAALTFVIWGLYHGSFLALERTSFGPFVERMPRILRHGYALLVVMIGWVFFRAPDFPTAGHFLCTLAGLGHATEAQPLLRYGTGLVACTMLIGIIGSTPGWKLGWLKLARTTATRPALRAFFLAADALGCLAVFFLALAWMAGETYHPFIYFRF